LKRKRRPRQPENQHLKRGNQTQPQSQIRSSSGNQRPRFDPTNRTRHSYYLIRTTLLQPESATVNLSCNIARSSNVLGVATLHVRWAKSNVLGYAHGTWYMLHHKHKAHDT
jgi:hypothetical protein